MSTKDQNNENLKDLFGKFLDPQQAKEAAGDIQKAEQLLRTCPAPEPDAGLIADIKTEITGALLRKKPGTFKQVVYKMASIAAAVILLTAITAILFQKGSVTPEQTAATFSLPDPIWESDNLADDDVVLAMLTAETEEIESEVLALQLDENGTNGETLVSELETELIEINSDFWKG